MNRLFKKNGPSLQRLRLATVVLVVSFALLMVATAIYYLAEQHNSALDNAARQARSAANAAQAHATRTFVETYRVLEGIGDLYLHNVEHGGFDDRALYEMLARRLEQTPGVYVFTLFDAGFKGVVSARSFPIDIEKYRDMPLRELGDAGNGRLFGPLYQNISPETGFQGEWSLPLAHVVAGKNGAVTGYATALINTRYFAHYFSTLEVGAFGRVTMWTRDGKLIAATPNVALARGDAAPEKINSPHITLQIAIADIPASIMVTLDERDYLAGWRQTRNQIGFAVATIILAMGSFTMIILRQLAHSQKNENALRQAKAAAEEANEAKSRFLAHMSHEFRTPLNAIMGFSEIIRNKVLGDGVSSTYTTYADHIHRSGEHLLNIVNDILDMAKIESGVQPLHQDTIDMRAVMSAAGSFVQGLATQRGLRIAVEAPAHLPSLRGDERFIRQVLINLLSNAIKFSPAGGEIVLWAAHRAGHWLDISVKDNGPGIEPTLLKRLGEPFLQGNPAVSHLGKGTGLGLSICKRYMDLLGGQLRIESIVGVGTTATIRFPNDLLAPAGG
ncbi:MAG: sensor histidine kinase [Rhodospirillaceae bacterium]